MKIKSTIAVVASVLFVAVSALAASVPVANYSFEANNGFNVFCGGSCEFSIGIPIPGWNMSGIETGQWITGGYAGNPPAFDGSILAYSAGGGAIWQDVGSAVSGTTYTLQVEVLHRTDEPMAGIVQLEVGGVVLATAAGPDAGPGTWNNFTATYTATAADAGKTLTILLSAPIDQGDWDFVRLDTTAVPEPMTILMLGTGIALGALKRGIRRLRL